MTRSRDRSALIDIQPTTDEFRDAVIAGLGKREKTLPTRFLYDRRGCQLFEQICELPEYYLTRAELAIMRRDAAEMTARIGAGAVLIEFGSGSGRKTRLLLDHLDRPAAYVPIDIAAAALRDTAAALADDYPDLTVRPVCADFARPLELEETGGDAARRVVYFPGSTIGNFEPPAAQQLLENIADLAGEGGGLLIGIDLKKDRAVLEAAYNDSRGVTARFNLNLLERINRELGADFEVSQFAHRAIYNESAGRVELYLESLGEQVVRLDGQEFEFAAGERICTEYSHKYEMEDFSRRAAHAGLVLRDRWLDDQQRFAVLYFAAADRN